MPIVGAYPGISPAIGDIFGQEVEALRVVKAILGVKAYNVQRSRQ
jgi:hypothetical protein